MKRFLALLPWICLVAACSQRSGSSPTVALLGELRFEPGKIEFTSVAGDTDKRSVTVQLHNIGNGE